MSRIRVLLINPNTSEASTEMMARLARAVLPAQAELVLATARQGAAMITTEAELAVAAQEVLAIGRARAPEVNAIVIGAFGNPGLAPLRAAVAIPVIGIGEAALREAAHGGRRFGVATTTPGLEDSIAQSVRALGLSAGFTGTRIPLDGPLSLAAEPARQAQRLGEAVQACIQRDGAQAVVIGGGPLSDAAETLARELPWPVISPIAAAMRQVRTTLLAAA